MARKSETKPPEWTAKDGPPTKPGHYHGEATGNGFNFQDGKFHISPGNQNIIRDLLAQEIAIRTLQNNVNEYAEGRLRDLAKRRIKFWADMIQDFGFPLEPRPALYFDEYGGYIGVKVPEPIEGARKP